MLEAVFLAFLNPPFALILDLALFFPMCMVGAVTGRFGVPAALAPGASFQTALDFFLINWFGEQMAGMERAEALVEYTGSH
ncbi:unnamed protein product [Schistocephalus solidus]|uniref:DctM domain-containing protein n=1 Tax=Schistocephalus solidus TaxID=70667 RepID=A0A183SYM5_SCHSO|nr:unnamed protein product [Schistocephalus solidus]